MNLMIVYVALLPYTCTCSMEGVKFGDSDFLIAIRQNKNPQF